MNTVKSESSHNKNTDDEDEELAQLRLAALLSRKSANRQNKQESTIENSAPQQSSFIQTQTGTSRKFWPNWRRATSIQKPSHRSNLIVINPVALGNATKGSETVPYPKLVLPQHRWCISSNEDSMSPKASNFKKKDASRFSRFESDSDSESDFDISSNSGEDSHTETQDEPLCEGQNCGNEVQEPLSSSVNVPSPALRESGASTVNYVEPEVLRDPIHSETKTQFERVNTSDNVSESSDEETVETCQLTYQKESFLNERDLLHESANVANLKFNNQVPINTTLSDLDNEINSKNISIHVNKVLSPLTSSCTEIISKETDRPSLAAKHSPGGLDLKDTDCVIKKCEYNDSELINGNELCNSDLFHVQRADVNCSSKLVEQSLPIKDLRVKIKKKEWKKDRRNRDVCYSEYTSSSESDSSSKHSYNEQTSDLSASLNSLSSDEQGSSDESLSPQVKSVLSVVKPISLESSDVHHNFSGKSSHETSLIQVSREQKDQKCSQKVEYPSSVEDACNYSHSCQRRRSSSSSVEKDYKKTTEDQFSDEVPDGWCKKRLPVHMRLGAPSKRRFAEADESGLYSRHNKFSGKYSTNDPKKTNFKIEVSDNFDDEDSTSSIWRKERSLKDDTHKKRKVTW